MTLEDPTVVDVAVIGKDGNVYLIISDAWEWGSILHLHVLQAKINAYLGLIEFGHIYDQVPEATPTNLVLQIVYKHEPDALGHEFLDKVAKIIRAEGVGFLHSTDPLAYKWMDAHAP